MRSGTVSWFLEAIPGFLSESISNVVDERVSDDDGNDDDDNGDVAFCRRVRGILIQLQLSSWIFGELFALSWAVMDRPGLRICADALKTSGFSSAPSSSPRTLRCHSLTLFTLPPSPPHHHHHRHHHHRHHRIPIAEVVISVTFVVRRMLTCPTLNKPSKWGDGQTLTWRWH